MKHSTQRLMKIFVLFIIVTLSSFGCALKPRPPLEVASPDRAMIYGNIRIPGQDITEVELREYGRFYMPPFVIPPRVMTFKNGDFAAENLKPGNYYISRVVSKKANYTLVNDGRSAYQWIITVKPGAFTYVGSYEISAVDNDKAVKGEFNMRTVRHPSERAVLKHMFDLTRGTGWQARVDRRIKSLR